MQCFAALFSDRVCWESVVNALSGCKSKTISRSAFHSCAISVHAEV